MPKWFIEKKGKKVMLTNNLSKNENESIML